MRLIVSIFFIIKERREWFLDCDNKRYNCGSSSKIEIEEMQLL